MTVRKQPASDLRNYYTLFLELGLLVSIIIFIIAVKIDITSSAPDEYALEEQEIVEMEEIEITKQIETPATPPRPQIPVEVPNDEIIEDVEIIIFEFDPDSRLNLPPTPPSRDNDEEEVFVVVEHMPEMIGGDAALYESIKYPEAARRAGIDGRVHVQFIVNEQGLVEDPVIIRGVHPALDQEALRAISEARFTPGMQRGRPVRVQMSQPIFFRLQ